MRIDCKLICINRDHSFKQGYYMANLYNKITIGKVYNAINYSKQSSICGVCNDESSEYNIYNSSCFITLKEYRKLKLIKLNQK